MKTYRITDEDGKVVEVKEYDEGEQPEEVEKPAAPANPEEEAHDEAFSPEQVEAIKKLIAEALAAAKNAEEPAPAAEETHDEDIEAAKEDEGEGGAIGNINAPKVGDSAKKGAGSIEKPSKAKDSDINLEEVDNAWENRFNKDK